MRLDNERILSFVKEKESVYIIEEFLEWLKEKSKEDSFDILQEKEENKSLGEQFLSQTYGIPLDDQNKFIEEKDNINDSNG